MVLRVVNFPLESATIGVLSDTHIPARAYSLPPSIFSIFENVALILHAGDIVEEQVLLELEALAPVEAVAGNMDPLELRHKLGTAKVINLGSVSVGLFHGFGARGTAKKKAIEEFHYQRVGGVIFGHTHEPLIEKRNGLLLVNPGSVTDPRRGSKPACAVLRLEKGTLEGEIMPL